MSVEKKINKLEFFFTNFYSFDHFLSNVHHTKICLQSIKGSGQKEWK